MRFILGQMVLAKDGCNRNRKRKDASVMASAEVLKLH